MHTGILLIKQTKRGYQVLLDRQNGRSPMPLSFLRLTDSSHHGQSCQYDMDQKGRISFLKVLPEGPILHPSQAKSFVRNRPPSKQAQGKPRQQSGRNQYRISPESCFLPRDTMRHLASSHIDNFSLKLNKTVNFQLEKGNTKPVLFKRKDRRGSYFAVEHRFGNRLLTQVHQRQDQYAQASRPSYQEARLQLDWRMIVGLGGESVYETSICLHHLYGLPYLPASAVKGLIRSSILNSCFRQGDQVRESQAMDNGLFAALFGCDGQSRNRSSQKGKVCFLDAWPLSAPVIEADLINPHYPAYQNGDTPPAGYQDPIPVPFLALSPLDEAGNPLCFRLGMYSRSDALVSDHQGYTRLCQLDGAWREGLSETSRLLDVCVYWLRIGMKTYGIGAKTAVGYGFLSG